MNGWRRAGERCRRIQDAIAIDAGLYCAVSATFVIACALVWFEHLTQSALFPVLLSAATLALFIWFVFYFRQAKRQAHSNSLGAKGETSVDRYLSRMDGAVFSNTPCPHGDIDHIFISAKGVFVLETKNWDQDKEIIYNGEALIFPNGTETTKPIDQARRNAAWLHSHLKTEHVFQSFIQPVVILLNKDVKTTHPDPQVHVYDISGFGAWHNKRPNRLSPEQQDKVALSVKSL